MGNEAEAAESKLIKTTILQKLDLVNALGKSFRGDEITNNSYQMALETSKDMVRQQRKLNQISR